jgi:hypothetical protein
MMELLVIVQLACVETYPGEKRPLDWAYRTIDGKKCWYQGPHMMPKSKLKWVIEEPVPMIPDMMIRKQPDEPEDDGTFQSRWRLK